MRNMMPIGEHKEYIIRKIVRYLVNHGASKVAFFGSFINGTEHAESDIDVLVTFPGDGITLLEHVGMEQELTELAGRKIDLVTEGSLSPYLVEQVEASMMVAYP